ncbi:hypothetical protein AB0H77_00445 [Streptomyces sp. NPDC050844]|uniref:hypothetical protein n=1 Tax=Streptomyces sp. NPDC050844 TaxID=3155790 RepID=UPI0033F29696
MGAAEEGAERVVVVAVGREYHQGHPHEQWALARRAQRSHLRHGRRTTFRQLISGIPTARLKARLMSMAAAQDLVIVAVDAAYTSKWGAQHWRKPMATNHRTMTGHDAASIAIGRPALGPRRRTPPPHTARGIVRGIGASRPGRAPRA